MWHALLINAWCFAMFNKSVFAGYLLMVLLLMTMPYAYPVFTYDVSDDSGLDYVDNDLNGLENIVDRVDIESMVVEVVEDSVSWRISYKASPLTNEEVLDGASNGSFVYRVMVDVGVSVNGGDGWINLNIMSGMEYDEAKQEYVLATVTWFVYDVAGNVITSGFGMYEVSGNDIIFNSKLPGDVVLAPPSQDREFLNLTSYINQQGKDLIIDVLAYKVDVDVNPRDFSDNVVGNDDIDDSVPISDDDDIQQDDGDNDLVSDVGDGSSVFLYLGVAAALVFALGIFLFLRKKV